MTPEAPADGHRVPSDHQLSTASVEAAFSEQDLWFWDQPARFKVVELDAVVITSGAVVVDDPMFGRCTALKRRVPPGSYPVSLAVVHLASGDERIAFARMSLSAAAVVAWETGWYEAIAEGSAMRDGQWQVRHREYAFYFADGAGAGCFMDAAAVSAIRNREFEAYIDMVNDGFGTNRRNTWSWLSFKPDPSREENVVCYQSEPGGRDSYFGLDVRGNAAVIITDFRMF
jgi:hypothetical protein